MMRHTLFRVALVVALLTWAALLIDMARMEIQRRRAIAAVEAAQLNPPTATPIVIPTLTPAPPEPVVHSSALRSEEAFSSAIHPKTGRYISAWLPTSFDADDARASFEANKDIIDELSPFWYGVHKDGTLAPEKGARDRELVRVAHESNVLVLPTVHNIGTLDNSAVVLEDPELRERHIQIIIDEVLEYNFDGIDIDYEMLTPDMRDEFNDFIVKLADELHSHGKLISIAVHAKSSDGGGFSAFQDWQVIGAAVDRLRIMTYDYHWRGGGPGPIAPLYWVEEVVEYARSVVDPAKVVVGIPFYGYNWGADGDDAIAMTWTDIQHLIEREDASVNLRERDSRGLVQESWFVYDGRTVWFSNHRSLEAKLELMQRLDLAGIAIWRLGNEDPENWNVIRRKLVQDPVTIQRQVNTFLPEH